MFRQSSRDRKNWEVRANDKTGRRVFHRHKRWAARRILRALAGDASPRNAGIARAAWARARGRGLVGAGSCSWARVRGRGLARARQIRRHAERSAAKAAPTNALDKAEIEIGILDRQCLDRRLPNRTLLAAEVAAWQQRRNAEGRGIAWTFTRQGADRKTGIIMFRNCWVAALTIATTSKPAFIERSYDDRRSSCAVPLVLLLLAKLSTCLILRKNCDTTLTLSYCSERKMS